MVNGHLRYRQKTYRCIFIFPYFYQQHLVIFTINRVSRNRLQTEIVLLTRVISVLVLYRSVPKCNGRLGVPMNIQAVFTFPDRVVWCMVHGYMVCTRLAFVGINMYVRPFVLGLDGGGGGGGGAGASILQRFCVRPVRYSSYFDPSS